jgi:hypothetical protein
LSVTGTHAEIARACYFLREVFAYRIIGRGGFPLMLGAGEKPDGFFFLITMSLGAGAIM